MGRLLELSQTEANVAECCLGEYKKRMEEVQESKADNDGTDC